MAQIRLSTNCSLCELSFHGIHEGVLTRRQSVAPEKARFSFKALNCSSADMTFKKCHLPLVRLLCPSSYASVGTERQFKGSVFSSLVTDNNTTPDPEILLPSHSLKVLEKPPNFMIKINVFIQLQMLELNTHTSRMSTSPFQSFSQVIGFFPFFFFIFLLIQSRATDYKEAV